MATDAQGQAIRARERGRDIVDRLLKLNLLTLATDTAALVRDLLAASEEAARQIEDLKQTVEHARNTILGHVQGNTDLQAQLRTADAALQRMTEEGERTLLLWREQDDALQRIFGATGIEDGCISCPADVAECVEQVLAENAKELQRLRDTQDGR